MSKGQQKADEFAFVLLAGLILIMMLTIGFFSIDQGNFQVSPSSRSLTIARGTSFIFNLEFNGTGKNITLNPTGEIANWISFNRNNFNLDGSTNVKVLINVPPNTPLRWFSGGIDIDFLGGKKTIDISINVSTETVSEESRSIYFGDFTVSYPFGTETIEQRDDFTISKGYFSSDSESFAGIVPEDKFEIITDGAIKLVIDETNSAGNLIVEFNGEVVFDGKVPPGEITIRLTKEQIRESNSIVLRAGTPGFRFWMSTVYRIREAKFLINFQGTSFKEFTFNLDNREVLDFVSARISFEVKGYDVARLNDMIIEINNQTVFKGVPTLLFFSKKFSNVNLDIGENIIAFKAEPNSYYEISDVTLTITRSI